MRYGHTLTTCWGRKFTATLPTPAATVVIRIIAPIHPAKTNSLLYFMDNTAEGEHTCLRFCLTSMTGRQFTHSRCQITRSKVSAALNHINIIIVSLSGTYQGSLQKGDFKRWLQHSQTQIRNVLSPSSESTLRLKLWTKSLSKLASRLARNPVIFTSFVFWQSVLQIHNHLEQPYTNFLSTGSFTQ